MVALPLVSWAYWRAKSRKIVNSKENKFRHAESDGSFGGTLNTAARSSRERDLECEMGPRGMISDSISTSIEWYSAISDRVQAVLGGWGQPFGHRGYVWRIRAAGLQGPDAVPGASAQQRHLRQER